MKFNILILFYLFTNSYCIQNQYEKEKINVNVNNFLSNKIQTKNNFIKYTSFVTDKIYNLYSKLNNFLKIKEIEKCADKFSISQNCKFNYLRLLIY